MVPLLEARARVRGCILGTAVGDARGMAVERMSGEEIRAQCYIEGYPDVSPRYRDGLRRGSWTDDTKLTVATAAGIVEAGSLDIGVLTNAILLKYLEALPDRKRGYGRTTRESLQDRLEGKDPFDGRHERRPGNGPPMKSAVLGVFSSLLAQLDVSWTLALECLVTKVSLLTHNDTRSLTAAFLQAKAAETLCSSAMREAWGSREEWSNHELVTHFIELGEYYEKDIDGDLDSPRVTDALRRLPDLLGVDDETIARTLGTSGAAYESFPTALCFALKYKNNFRSAVRAGVNAGGDTDTIAAMTGALVGSYLGEQAIPPEWLQDLEAREELIALADRLWGTAAWLAYRPA